MKSLRKLSCYCNPLFCFFIAFLLTEIPASSPTQFLFFPRTVTLATEDSHPFQLNEQAIEIIENSDNLAGFEMIATAKGVTLYKRDLNYVQVVDFSQGASVEFLTGNLVDPGIGNGAYGGNDPQFLREPLSASWENFRATHAPAFCMVNSQFFRDDEHAATGLAFPIKINGNFLTDGYAGDSEYPAEKMMLQVWSDRIAITPFTLEAFRQSSAPNILVSLSEDAEKGRDRPLPRTFIGVQDNNQDGQGETLLILSSSASTQPQAAQTLRELGATEVMMLDGGGSTQLRCQEMTYIASLRTLPQTIGILSAPE